MKKIDKEVLTDNNPLTFEELSDWSGFKGVIGRGYKQAMPNPSVSFDRFLSMLEKSLNDLND